MARKIGGGGLGFLVLVIVAAIVMYLWAKDAERLAPTALSLQDGGASAFSQPEAAAELRSGRLPRVHEMKQATDQYAADVEAARTEIDASVDGDSDN